MIYPSVGNEWVEGIGNGHFVPGNGYGYCDGCGDGDCGAGDGYGYGVGYGDMNGGKSWHMWEKAPDQTDCHC
jgi:hypothetical protein